MKTIMWIFLFVSMSLISCTRIDQKFFESEYLPNCTSENCVDVNIKGSLYVVQTGEKLKNVSVEVFFIPKNGLSMLFSEKVVSGKTDKNGIFNFNTVIDTTLFKDRRLAVWITRPKNYIIPSIHNNHEDLICIDFYNYDAEALQNIDIACYKKATLTINLNRTQADDCSYFQITSSFVNQNSTLYILPVSELGTNKVLQTETASDIYTIIEWKKTLKTGEEQFYTDSLICRQNKNNVFDINY